MNELDRLRAAYRHTLEEYQEANAAMLRVAEVGGAEDFHAASVRVAGLVQKLKEERAALAECLKRHEAEVQALAFLGKTNQA